MTKKAPLSSATIKLLGSAAIAVLMTSPFGLVGAVQAAEVDLQRWAAEPLALRSRPAQPCPHALGDEAPLKLRDGGDDSKHRLPERRARVDMLAERDELDAEVPEELQGLDQVFHGGRNGGGLGRPHATPPSRR